MVKSLVFLLPDSAWWFSELVFSIIRHKQPIATLLVLSHHSPFDLFIEFLEYLFQMDDWGIFHIQSTIRDAVEDSITWPVRKVIPIIPGDYR